jgi:hypothetical protein
MAHDVTICLRGKDWTREIALALAPGGVEMRPRRPDRRLQISQSFILKKYKITLETNQRAKLIQF